MAESRRAGRLKAISNCTAAVMAVAAIALGVFATPARAGGASGKVVIVVVDRTGPRDIDPRSTPFLAGLANSWSVGMMVTRTLEKATGREPDSGADYVTLAAGARAKGARSAALNFDSDEVFAGGPDSVTAGRYMKSTTGHAPPESGIACLGMPAVRANSQGTGTEDNISLLGRELRRAGRTAAAVGNQDSRSGPIRLSALLACDPGGSVQRGHVAGLTLPAPDSPGGVVTDMEGLLAASADMLSRSDLLVIDTGDTGRVDREGALMEPDVLAGARASALRRVDAFTSRLAGLVDLETSLLLVVSPGAPSEARAEGDYATPFIAAGRGFSRGLLTSSSTRRPGFVNNTDLVATVLDHFGLPAPSQAVGAAMVTSGRAPGGVTNLEYVTELDRQFSATRTARWPVVLGYLICVGIFLILSLACIPIVAKKLRLEPVLQGLMRMLRPIGVVLLAMPASFLLVSAFSFESWMFPLVFCVAYALVVGLGALLISGGNRRVDAVTLVCTFSAAIMMVDMLFGGRLLIFPLLGSSAQDGMRFYGISNAVSGMLIAYGVFGIMGLGSDASCRKGPARLGVFAGLAILTFFVGFGLLGGDFGGFITMAVTALVLFFATGRKGLRGWRIPLVVAGTLVATAFLLLADALFVHTHASHALAAGSGQVLPLIGRKALILLTQIKSVLVLALVMVASVVAMVLWMRRPGSFWNQRWVTDRAFTASLFALLAGSIVALLLNDTGIGMMGTMVMVAIPVTAFHFMSQVTGKDSPAASRRRAADDLTG